MKKFTLVALVLFCSILLNAQWQPLNGPFGGTVECFLVKDQLVFVAMQGHGVFRSSDNGNNWTPVNNGLVTSSITSLAYYGSKIYAVSAQPGGLFVSNDNGNSWNTVIINGNASVQITAVAANAQNLLIGTSGGDLLRSTDNGSTWTTSITPTTGILTIAISGPKIFIGVSSDWFYRSLNNGGDFEKVNFPGRCCQMSFAFKDSKIYMATEGYVYYSTDDGDIWNDIFTGMDVPCAVTLMVKDNNLYAGCVNGGYANPDNQGGVYVFNDGTSSWTNIGLLGYAVWYLCTIGNRILAGPVPGSIFITDNDGSDWTESTNGLVKLGVTAMTRNGSSLFAATAEEGIFISQDHGNSWHTSNNGLVSYADIVAFAVGPQTIFVGNSGGIQVSSDNGSTWRLLFSPGYKVTSFILTGSDIYAGTYGGGIFKSSDNGETWKSVNNGLGNTNVQSMTLKGTAVFAGTDFGVYKSTDQGDTWSATNTGLPYPEIVAMASTSQNLFASAVDPYVFTYQAGIFRSDDDGAHWIRTGPELEWNNYATSLIVDQGKIFAGMANLDWQACFSNDNGTSWSVVNTGLPLYSGIKSMMIMDSDIYACVTDASFWPANLGAWNRPLIELIAFRAFPDSLLLLPEQGDSKTLAITSSTAWTLTGNIPGWLSVNTLTGEGSGNIVFSTTQTNPYDEPRFVSFDIVSEGISRHITIGQNGKLIGIEEKNPKTITLYPNPSNGIITLKCNIPFETLTIYNSLGQTVVTEKITSPVTRLDLSSEGKGIYWIKLSGQDRSLFREVVVL